MRHIWFMLVIASLTASYVIGQEDARFSLQIGAGKSYPIGQDESATIQHWPYPQSVSSAGARLLATTNDFWDILDNGTNLVAGAGIHIWPRIWARGRFYYNDFKIKNYSSTLTNEKYTVYGLGLDWIIYPALNSANLVPYVYLGGGISGHTIRANPENEPMNPADTSDYPIYIMAGAGIEMPIIERLSAFVEFAYIYNNSGDESRSFIPVSLGIKSYFGWVRHR